MGVGNAATTPNWSKNTGWRSGLTKKKNFPFIVISPQCPTDTRWIDLIEKLNTLLEHILATYPVDKNRVHLTGLSMGGQGAWCLAAFHPEKFAAVVPICGPIFPDYEKKLCALKNIPVWVFHGEKDEMVSVKNSYRMAEKLQACGGNVRLTIFPDENHFCWDRVYTNPEVYAFFGSDWQSFS